MYDCSNMFNMVLEKILKLLLSEEMKFWILNIEKI